MRNYLIFLASLTAVLFFVKNSWAGTESACGASQPENCVAEFLSNPVVVEVPPLGCYHKGLKTVLFLPVEWGCKNPVNHANQPSWCYCNDGYEAAEAEFKAAAEKVLPASIPYSRFKQVMNSMSEAEKRGSLALRDWNACGHTVDVLFNILLGSQ